MSSHALFRRSPPARRATARCTVGRTLWLALGPTACATAGIPSARDLRLEPAGGRFWPAAVVALASAAADDGGLRHTLREQV